MDTGLRWYLFILLWTPLVDFVLHWLTVRWIPSCRASRAPLHITALAIIAGYFLLALTVWHFYLHDLAWGTRLCAIFYGTLVYGSLSFCYFILFAMTESARRIHIMRKLYASSGMSVSELSRTYNQTDMLHVRLDRMVSLGQLKRFGERYQIDRRLLYVVGAILFFWSGILGFKRGADS